MFLEKKPRIRSTFFIEGLEKNPNLGEALVKYEKEYNKWKPWLIRSWSEQELIKFCDSLIENTSAKMREK